MSLTSMLRSTCTLERKSTSKDASGGMVNTFAAVSGYSGISCDVQTASGTTQQRYMQEKTIVTHTIYFDQDVPAKAGDRFTNDDGETFLFKGRRPPSKGYDAWPCVVDVEEQLT